LCRVHGRERPVWSCGVVEWFGRPPNEQPVAWSDSWSHAPVANHGGHAPEGFTFSPFWRAFSQKNIPALRQAGYESISDLPRIQQSYKQKALVVIPPVTRICATSNGKQRVKCSFQWCKDCHRNSDSLCNSTLN